MPLTEADKRKKVKYRGTKKGKLARKKEAENSSSKVMRVPLILVSHFKELIKKYKETTKS